MQIIDVPGIGEVEFPDGMGDAEIVAAVRKLSAPPMAASHSGPAYEPPRTGALESGVRGALQGASFGFGDEAAAAVESVLPSFLRNDVSREAVGDGATVAERYRNARDYYRNRNATAQESNPGTYLASQVAGAAVPALVGGAPVSGVRAPPLAAGQGAAQGAGYSEDEGLGLARDTALGGALGTAGYGAGALVGKGAAAAVRKGRDLVRTGTDRARQQAAEAATDAVNSLEGAARERAANAYRQMERVNLALADKSLPAQERAALEAFKQSPEYAELLAANAKGILAAAPEAAAEREAARQIAAQARGALPTEIALRTAEGLKPQVKADTKSFLKSYAEPALWALGAQQAGSALGLDPSAQGVLAVAAGTVGGRTRAGKALWTRMNRPAHQVAVGEMLERAGSRPLSPQGQLLMRALQRAGVAGAAPMLVDDQ